MTKSDTYCILPHTAMAFQNNADICCCNVNSESWKNKKHEVMFVHSHPLKDAFKSYSRRLVATALDNGIKHPSCQVCWDQESAGTSSLRQLFNNQFANITPLPDQPRILIIKPGNTCNFACRMCGPDTSSGWYQDGHKLDNSGITFNEYTRTFDTIRNSFNQDNNELWGTLKEWIVNFELIEIYGGEPFLIPAVFDLLDHGVNIGASKHISVRLHTNASIFNQQYLDTLAQYKTVDFHVSIDSNIPTHLEYIRYGAVFDQVIENSQKFSKFFKTVDSASFGVTYTLTPLNVYYVNDAVPALEKLFDVKIPNLNIVTTPEYDIRHMPVAVKDLIIKTTKFDQVRNFLKQQLPTSDAEWLKFCHITDRLDNLRGQNFQKTFPEWWAVLEPYWTNSEV